MVVAVHRKDLGMTSLFCSGRCVAILWGEDLKVARCGKLYRVSCPGSEGWSVWVDRFYATDSLEEEDRIVLGLLREGVVENAG